MINISVIQEEIASPDYSNTSNNMDGICRKTRFCKVLLILSGYSILFGELEGKDSFVSVPSDTTAPTRSEVNLTWEYQVDSADVLSVNIGFGKEKGTIQYKYKLEPGKLVGPNDYFNDNVNITAIVPITSSKGAVQVFITNVSLGDAGYFACKLIRFSPTMVDYVKLIVTAVTSSPTTTQAVTSSPTTTQASTSSPTTREAVTSSPTTTQAVTSSPTTTQAVTSSPTTTQAVTSSPTTTQAVTSSPTTTQAVTSSPTTTQGTGRSPQDQDSKDSRGKIIGGIAGSIIVVIVLSVAGYTLRKKCVRQTLIVSG